MLRGLTLFSIVVAACPNGKTVTGGGAGGSTVKATDCTSALTRFAKREFTSLEGLPAGCTPGDVAAVFTPFGSPTRGRLGDPKRDVELRHYRIEGWTQDVRGWFDGGRLILVDTDDPVPRTEWRSLVERLGEPEGRLDYAWHMFVLDGAEWVYAARGVAIVVKPDPGLILRLALFTPTTVDAYARDVRFRSEHREEE